MSIEEFYAELDSVDPGSLVIVEGINDMKALRKLGLDCSILPINKRPLYQVVEKAAGRGKQTVLLVDLDKEGRKLYRYLYHHLTRHGVKIDNRFRRYLFRTPVREIENLYGFIRNLSPYNFM